MKRNLTLIALIATALMSSCGSSQKTEDAVVMQAEKPKVKIAKANTEAVAQLEEYATTVEAEVKNNIIPNSPLRIAKILVAYRLPTHYIKVWTQRWPRTSSAPSVSLRASFHA